MLLSCFFNQCECYDENSINRLKSDMDNNVLILHSNIRSLQKNIDELVLYLNKLKHSEIIAIFEVKLQNNAVHINFQLDGYDFVHVDSSTKAGGLGLFVKNKIDFITRDNIKLNLLHVGNLWIEINVKPKIVRLLLL